MTLRYGSVCSGIEAAALAFRPLGWEAAWFAETDPFCRRLLTHHYPTVPNFGDMRLMPDIVGNFGGEAPDLLVGGTPCQAFSVAGNRLSLQDDRGNLALSFCRLADSIDLVRVLARQPHAVLLWENVPGVLSVKDNAFGCFIGALARGAELRLPSRERRWPDAGMVVGSRRAVAWRVLDAQYFGLAQRRRRVWVVASARDGFDPGAVLFEFEGMRRDSPPRRETREEAADCAAGGVGSSGVVGALQVAGGPNAHGFGDFLCNQAVDAGHVLAFGGNDTRGPIEIAAALNTNHGCHNPGDFEAGTLLVPPLRVRRLTPTECERLQGFPDGYTNVGLGTRRAGDGPRYAALGNTWAVNNARWIAERITKALLATA